MFIRITGLVQGVGFRPFVYRLAKRYGLKGYTLNDGQGVVVEVEGEKGSIEEFIISLKTEKPSQAKILRVEVKHLPDILGYQDFTIRESNLDGKKYVSIPPDLSVCDTCIAEMLNPKNRRYLYPFISCTDCGPRFSIIEKIPYDRQNTTMKTFKMCPECEKEYKDPHSHRFHSQINACPHCGPDVFLYSKSKELLEISSKAIRKTAQLIKDGHIVAVKGLGGFHLVCDATSDEAVKKLRERKKRDKKPFAVMFKDLNMLKKYTKISKFEEEIISSAEKPIVLVQKIDDSGLSRLVAPDISTLGVFLPYTPVHHLLFLHLDVPLVVTSANLSDEPIVKDNLEAFEKLSSIADYLLVHNRDIINRVDDSVVLCVEDKRFFIRKARGYAPSTINLPFKIRSNILAVGGHQKVTIAVAFDDRIILSQHIADLDSPDSRDSFEESVNRFLSIYQILPDIVVSDLHPSYFTTKWAEDFSKKHSIKHTKVQHHYAHALSLMLDRNIDEKILAVCWDGTGYGVDGKLWGGEFLVAGFDGFERAIHFRNFRLIGGEKAIREPERIALSMLFEIFGKDISRVVSHMPEKRLEGLYTAWEKGINSPLSSSAGRLFDAVAWLTGIVDKISYEGQSGLLMERFYDAKVKDRYPYSLKDGVIDWTDIILGVLQDRKDVYLAVSRFINTLAEIVVDVSSIYQLPAGLTGGVFQNRPLVIKIMEITKIKGIELILHKNVPPNDGGIAVGQIGAVLNMVK